MKKLATSSFLLNKHVIGQSRIGLHWKQPNFWSNIESLRNLNYMFGQYLKPLNEIQIGVVKTENISPYRKYPAI